MPETNIMPGLQVVIHHENIRELASLRFLKLNLECQNIKMGRRIYGHLFCFFHETMFYISIKQSESTVVSIAAVYFYKKQLL